MSRSAPDWLTRRVTRLLAVWLRRVAPPHWADSVLGDLNEDAPGTFWPLLRLATRLTVEQVRQRFRPVRRWPGTAATGGGDALLLRIWRDGRIAVRGWVRTPTAALAIMLTLAIGIGANTAVFSVVHGVLLQPLPYVDPDALVALARTTPDQPGGGAVSSEQYDAWHNRTDLFANTAAFQAESFTVATPDTPSALWSIRGARTSATLFPLLGVQPLQGRWLRADDEDIEAQPAVVISARLWSGRLNGRPDVIGSALVIDNRRYDIVGVMPASFDFPGEVDAWTAINPLGMRMRGLRIQFAFLSVVARLRPDVTVDQASAALAPPVDEGTEGQPVRAVATSLLDSVVRPVRPMVLLASSAVALVLLIACANVAGLLMVRAAGRRRELAIRRALGASDATLVRESIVESGLLTLCGGALGVTVAGILMPALRATLPSGFPRAATIGIDSEVLLFITALCIVTAVLFGAGPTLLRLRTLPLLALKASGQGVLGLRTRRQGLRGWAVAMQMALCVVLLSATSLLLTSFVRLTTVDRGFEMDNMVVATVMPVRDEHRGDIRGLFDDVVGRLQASPGIERVALTDNLPLDDFGLGVEFLIDGDNPSPPPRTKVVSIGPDFFDTLGVRILQGRPLTNAEVRERIGVAVVSETFAHQYLGDAALGRFVIIGGQPYEIVGVAADMRTGLGALEIGPTLYRAIDSGVHDLGGAQFVTPTHILIRTRPGADVLAVVGEELDRVSSGLQVTSLGSLDARLWSATAGPRFYSVVFGLFGGAGILLVAVGIYGLTAHVVAAGAHEIAVRLALGADRADVLTLVLRRGLTAAAIGGGVGLMAAALTSPALAGLLVGISPLNPSAYVGVIVFATVTMAVACIAPALSACRIAPMRALKND